MYSERFKRLFDVTAAALGLLLLSPLLLLVAWLIRRSDGGPVFFRQPRVGAMGRRFVMLKFRSMPVDAPQIPSGAAGGLPVTRIGKLIRRLNIDEVPQLINVLCGEMSLIGPRPALPEQTDLLALRRQNGAWRLRPGLTGLAQVHAYDGMPTAEKAAYDGAYCARLSLFGDLKILARTLPYLLKQPPVY